MIKKILLFGIILLYSIYMSAQTDNGHKYIDLGLSVKWADCNIGADAPEEYGAFFAWGETSYKVNYDKEDYSLYDKSTNSYTDIGTNISATKYDAAHVQWGGNWRLPTYKELKELTDKCDWYFTTKNGVNGYEVTGPTGKSIFLPASGYRHDGSTHYLREYGFYWTSTPYRSDQAYNLDGNGTGESTRTNGLTIRPVTTDNLTVFVSSIILNKSSLTLTDGDSQTLTATAYPSNASNKDITWSSSNSNIATVDQNGIVEAKSPGTATITATANDGSEVKGACTLTVKAISVSKISISNSTLSITEGESQTLTATAYPTNASNKSISWSSGNTDIATVNQNGTVTAKSPGTTTIIASASDGSGVKATCSVTVKRIYITSISINNSSISLIEGNSQALTATIYPASATKKDITWASSNTDIATVSQSGTVKAIYPGTATITVAANDGSGVKAACSVTVKGTPVSGITLSKSSLSLTQYDSQTLTAKVSPTNAFNKNIIWSSSNTNIATVDQNGNVKALYPGTATITATASDESGIKATCSVSVKELLVSGIVISNSSLTITEGDSYALTATVSPANAFNKNITWTSNNTDIATVDQNGNVKAIYPGTATITATADGGNNVKATCSVNVKGIPVSNITIARTSLSLGKGESWNLITAIYPVNAFNKVINWSTSDDEIATVDQNGTVTAKSSGTATITATASDGSGAMATCTITVVPVYENGYEYIDLGLSVKWATCNIGAENSEDYGLYFAWGETIGYPSDASDGRSFSWSEYMWGTQYEIFKYCTNDNKTVLESSDDAAIANWGGSWRMPTYDELNELIKNCTCTRVVNNGVYGYKITGPNGNSIFFPAADCRVFKSPAKGGDYGYYWSSSLIFNGTSAAYNLVCKPNGIIELTRQTRTTGYTIRPVCLPTTAPITKTYAITFIDEEGSIIKSELVEEGEAPTSPYAPSKSGYTFTCWQPTITNATADAIYTAVYSKNKEEAKPEAVDLGLSVKWATCNIGASSPEDYGLYFAWGETTGYTSNASDGYSFSISNYKWCNGSEITMTKYCTDSSYGTVDDKTTLESADDAAIVNWGDSWRMPTIEEQDELLKNCKKTWTTQNGVKGLKITAKNGNSIFLPAAGLRGYKNFSDADSIGTYWTSSLTTDGEQFRAYSAYFISDGVYQAQTLRYCGCPIRPVYSEASSTDIAFPTTSANKPEGIYNIAGQRISSLKKGINIVNGKKIFVK